MMEGVAHALCKAAVDIVPNVNRLAAAVRRSGGKVFWVQNTHDEACMESWSHMHAMVKPEKRAHRVRVDVGRNPRSPAVGRSRGAAGG